MMNKITFTLILFSVSFNVSALTISDAVKNGLQYNLAVKMSEAQRDTAEFKLGESYASYWPQVNLIGKTRTKDYNEGPYYIRDDDEANMLNIAAQYTLVDLARSEQVNSAKHALEAADWNNKIQSEKLTFDIIKASLGVWKSQRELVITTDYLNSIKSLTDKVNARVNGGLSPDSDAIRALATLDDARTRKENVEKELSNSQNFLASMIGVEDKLTLPISEMTENRIPDVINKQQPEQVNLLLKMMDAQSAQKRSEYEFVKKDDYPKVQVISNYKKRFNTTVQSPDTQVYVQVSMPIFNGFMTTNKIGAAATEIQLADYKRETALRDLHRNFTSLKVSMQKEMIAWKYNKGAIDKSEKTLRLYQDEFVSGDRTLSDIISAQRELFNARKTLLESRYNFNTYISAVFNLYGSTIDSIKYF